MLDMEAPGVLRPVALVGVDFEAAVGDLWVPVAGVMGLVEAPVLVVTGPLAVLRFVGGAVGGGRVDAATFNPALALATPSVLVFEEGVVSGDAPVLFATLLEPMVAGIDALMMRIGSGSYVGDAASKPLRACEWTIALEQEAREL